MMTGSYGVLVILSLFGFCYTINLDIKSDGQRVNLIPQTGNGRVETLWKLKACKGCKMVLGCAFKTTSCKEALLKIDTGGEFSQHCPDDGMSVFNTSLKHNMQVTIEHNSPKLSAYCQVRATKPFIDLPETVVDSSEHGSERSKAAKSKPSCRCGWTNKSPKRIVGGKEAGINEYPFIVLLIEKQSRFPFCGASIITARHVLSAAHCTYPNSLSNTPLSVIVGEHDIRTWKETSATKIIDVEKIIDHPQYNNITEHNDISLLYLKEDVPFSDFVGRVCLPKAQGNLMGQMIKVMGWGLDRDEDDGGKASPVLRKVDVKVIDLGICSTIYSMIDTSTAKQICTYNNAKDSCQGDSGGPLVIPNSATNMLTQVAVVSFGRKCASTDPGVNTDVAFYMDWIKKVIKDTKNVEICQ